jgi:hypothetical protein
VELPKIRKVLLACIMTYFGQQLLPFITEVKKVYHGMFNHYKL